MLMTGLGAYSGGYFGAYFGAYFGMCVGMPGNAAGVTEVEPGRGTEEKEEQVDRGT